MYDLIRNILIAKKCDLYIVIIFIAEKSFFFFLEKKLRSLITVDFFFIEKLFRRG